MKQSGNERKIIRLQHWDYSWRATYHVTIITGKRTRWLGFIESGTRHLSPIGRYAHDQLAALDKRHSGLVNHAFVVMPDHIHLLITLPYKKEGAQTPNPNRFGPQASGSLATVINLFKGAVTKWARQSTPAFSWHGRYHEHIIRDDANFANTIRYIRENPTRWRG